MGFADCSYDLLSAFQVPGLVQLILTGRPACGDYIMPTLQMRELRSPSSSAIEALPQVLGLSQRPALPLGGTLPPPRGLGATSFGKGTQSEQPASSLVGLAIPNQFFLSSWEHSPELPSCHSFPSQLKTALFGEPDPPPQRCCCPGAQPADVAPGPVGSGEVYLNLEMFLDSLRILSLIAPS